MSDTEPKKMTTISTTTDPELTRLLDDRRAALGDLSRVQYVRMLIEKDVLGPTEPPTPMFPALKQEEPATTSTGLTREDLAALLYIQLHAARIGGARELARMLASGEVQTELFGPKPTEAATDEGL